jgi:hypothetical protein
MPPQKALDMGTITTTTLLLQQRPPLS